MTDWFNDCNITAPSLRLKGPVKITFSVSSQQVYSLLLYYLEQLAVLELRQFLFILYLFLC